jgi:hypothetical protein
MLTTRWFSPAPELHDRVVYVEHPAPPAVAPTQSAAALELKAMEADTPRSDLYREAGNRYASQEYDLSAALRCFSSSLDAAPMEELTTNRNDHWLLMAIKDARTRENTDAQ